MWRYAILSIFVLSACVHRSQLLDHAKPIDLHKGDPYSVVGERVIFSQNGLLVSVQKIEPSQVPELPLPQPYPPPYHLWPQQPLTLFIVQVINRSQATIQWNPRFSSLSTNQGMRLPCLDTVDFHHLGIDREISQRLFYSQHETFKPATSRVSMIAFPPLSTSVKAFQLRLSSLFVGSEEILLAFPFSTTKVSFDSP